MLAFIVFAVLLLVLLLAVPVGLVFALRKEHQWTGRVHLYWMFGLVRIRLRPGGSSKRRERLRPDRTQGLRRSPPGRKRFYARKSMAILRSPGVVPCAFRLLRDMVRASKPRRLRARLLVGMEDPADTGFVAGLLAPMRLLLRSRRGNGRSKLSFDITPYFGGPRFRVYGCASLHFIPLQMIGLCIGFLFSAPVVRAFRAARTADAARASSAARGTT